MMIKQLTLTLLASSTLLVCSDVQEEVRKLQKLIDQYIAFGEVCEKLCPVLEDRLRYVEMPDASVLDTRLKTALGEQYATYVKHNPQLCTTLAGLPPFPPRIISNMIQETLHHLEKNKRGKVKSDILKVFVQDNKFALAYLQEHGDIQ